MNSLFAAFGDKFKVIRALCERIPAMSAIYSVVCGRWRHEQHEQTQREALEKLHTDF
jgi:hypothetical protein